MSVSMSPEAVLEAQLRQQRAVAELSQQALEGAPLQSLIERAVGAVAGGLDVEYAEVLERLPDDEALLLRAGAGWRAGLVGTALPGAGTDSETGDGPHRNQVVLVEDLAGEAGCSAA